MKEKQSNFYFGKIFVTKGDYMKSLSANQVSVEFSLK